MPEFQAILFDFDGVLLDSEPVHWSCWAEELATVGVALTWDYYRRYCIGIDDRDMLRVMAEQADPPRDWRDLWSLYPAKKERFRARMIAEPVFDSALAGLLGQLHERYKLAVVSSSSCSEIEPLLVAGGLRGHFDTLIGGEQVARHKPAPDPYLLAASRLNVTHALVLEDSPAGIASGRAAGFEVLAVERPSDVPELLRQRLGA
jgi:beta-phosphoglucomutase